VLQVVAVNLVSVAPPSTTAALETVQIHAILNWAVTVPIHASQDVAIPLDSVDLDPIVSYFHHSRKFHCKTYYTNTMPFDT